MGRTMLRVFQGFRHGTNFATVKPQNPVNMETITLDTIYRELKMLGGRLDLLGEMLSEKITKEREYTDEAELIREIGTVTKSDAASILGISERHILRYKDRYSLPTTRVGREVHYYRVPIVRAIQKHKLPWSEKAYQRVLASKKMLPVI